MTTAEFAKANLAALDEPVEIRRYTTVIGTYYPAGFAQPLAVPTLSLALDAGLAEISAQKRVDDLEDEVKRLKRLLAAKQPAVTQGNAFSDLSKQDREFFERKLGKKK
jgi:hypothetical protein